MITMTIIFQAIPEKQHELVQTLHELQTLVGREKGCCHYAVSQPDRHSHAVVLGEEWETAEDFCHYVRSEHFRVLLGAIKILTQTSNMTICAESQSASMDVKRANQSQRICLWVENTLSDMAQHARD